MNIGRALRWGYLVPAASAQAIRYAWLLRRKPLPEFAADLRVLEGRDRRPPPRTIVTAVRIGTRRGSVGAKCLVQSLVTARFLARFGYPAEVVIGVPRGRRVDDRWRAHAWVVTPSAEIRVEPYDEIARLSA